MRVKTEAKRAEVIAAAVSVFTELGYEGTSMEDIRSKAGCSKGTLYSYFPSKDELFLQGLLEATAQEASEMEWEMKATSETAEQFLERLGVSFLCTLYAPRFQALRRLAFSAPNAEAGQSIYNHVVAPYEARLTATLTSLVDNGKLRKTDPKVAAHHLAGLLESELLMKFLLRAIEVPSKEELEGAATRAVRAFIAAYAPSKSKKVARLNISQ